MKGLHFIDLPMTTYLNHFRRFYPGIIEWYHRAKEDVLSGRRSMFVSWKESEVQGLAITKNGVMSKLCHISVLPTARDLGLGSTLMSLALSDMVRNGAQEIHVTTDEEVLRNHAEFFRVSGFRLIDWQVNRYRKGSSELVWKMKVKFDQLDLQNISNETDQLGTLCAVSNIISTSRQFTACRNAIEGWGSRFTSKTLDKSLRDSLCKIAKELGEQDESYHAEMHDLLSWRILDSGVLDKLYSEPVRQAVKNASAFETGTMIRAIENARALHNPLMHSAFENLRILQRPVLHEALENAKAFNAPAVQQAIENAKALHNPVMHQAFESIKRFETPMMQEAIQAAKLWHRHPLSGQSITPHINVEISPKRRTELSGEDSVIKVEVLPNFEDANSPEPTTASDTGPEESARQGPYEFNNFPVSVTLIHRPNTSHSYETAHRLRKPSTEEWQNWSLNIKSYRRYLSQNELEEYNADKSEDDIATDVCELSYSEWEADEKLYDKVILEVAGVTLDKGDDFPKDKFRALEPEVIGKLAFETKTSVITRLYECYCGLERGVLEPEQRISQSLSHNASSFEVIHVLRKPTEAENYTFRTTIVSASFSTDEQVQEIVRLSLNLPVAIEFYDKLVMRIENATVDGQLFCDQTRSAFLAAINPVYKLRVLEPLFNINAWYFKVDDMNFP